MSQACWTDRTVLTVGFFMPCKRLLNGPFWFCPLYNYLSRDSGHVLRCLCDSASLEASQLLFPSEVLAGTIIHATTPAVSGGCGLDMPILDEDGTCLLFEAPDFAIGEPEVTAAANSTGDELSDAVGTQPIGSPITSALSGVRVFQPEWDLSAQFAHPSNPYRSAVSSCSRVNKLHSV